MDIIWVILSLALTGIIVGALGRLAIPGPNPMSIGMTILCGLGGALLGALVAGLLGARPDENAWIIFALQIAGAALIVWLVTRRRGGISAY